MLLVPRQLVPKTKKEVNTLYCFPFVVFTRPRYFTLVLLHPLMPVRSMMYSVPALSLCKAMRSYFSRLKFTGISFVGGLNDARISIQMIQGKELHTGFILL